ncbi:5-methyltetrahydropteroyltriglutamate--homocysteine S-methyltransferase [Mobiluncus mulieris]|uniref:5-methyltetrahydropteroyltriglutamate-- homocysteine S-methyltransferase n=1 Tax=Mobiluncus mulieris TaxID=2052 RepID=UPI0021E24A2C|nr:5-methyltetrahydropteroyltriglutamate--homocysteine S-methyltransferase [Mobiluncus mulieris]MCV0011500.1 5-methyltetrahydropteroyltriglutamate--homocysteine S-methyltransferase [Mobiluncus mulieris]
MPQTTLFPAATIAGYPRIGARRELKRSLERYWAGKIDRATFDSEVSQQINGRISHLKGLGLDGAAAQPADFVPYDQVLTLTCALGAVPQRFGNLVRPDGSLDVDGEFTLARGVDDKSALEMTKWFDTNYHYLVPEIGLYTPIKPVANPWLSQVAAGGKAGRPVLVGPVTYLLGAKPTGDAPAQFNPLDRLDDVLAAFEVFLAQFAGAGVDWVQLDEPGLVRDTWALPRTDVLAAAAKAYDFLGGLSQRPALFVNAPYGDLGSDGREALAGTPIEAIGLDLVAGQVPAAEDLARLEGKTVVAGVVSGRNIWRTDFAAALEKLRQVQAVCPRVAVSTSTSLQHVPHDVAVETAIDPEVRSWLTFADQKIAEVQVLARALADSDSVHEALAENARILETRAKHPGVRRAEVRAATAAVVDGDRTRAPYAERVAAQRVLDLPLLPTTTIGSFPQTTEIRRARAAWRKGEIDDAGYRDEIKAEIARVVRLQEDLGLDVLVHGEAERNDMVQYFAEQLEGFATTEHGWVQSYGSRCTRPSILWGDVTRPRPMTVEWSAYAQGLTSKPMKGMLTGPVTIMAWSFVRDDVPRREVADQIGLALRAEIADLEASGIRIIQVDEPAIRELLPLRRAGRAAYLDWSVGAFRLATGGAKTATQIHTHLCYSEFNVVVDAIDHLDADVTSIEASRSKMDILPAVADHGFERGLGPGIWDIHSPRVPKLDEEIGLLEKAVAALDPRQLWVNPDCGLKTRAYPETVATLQNLVAAAKAVRQEIQDQD